jgi:hypothetical protein
MINTVRKNTLKEKKKDAHEDTHTRASSHVGAKEVSLLKENRESQHIQRGRSTSNTEGGIVHNPHKRSSSSHKI